MNHDYQKNLWRLIHCCRRFIKSFNARHWLVYIQRYINQLGEVRNFVSMLWWTQLSCHFRFGFHSYGLRGLVILSVGERLAAGKWSDISWAAVPPQGRVWIINSRVEPRFDRMQIKDIQKFESVPSSQSWDGEQVWNQKHQLSFDKLCLFTKVLKFALGKV